MNTLKLAHYYTTPDVQRMSDHVGDSLDLSRKAAESNPDRIVFAGVRFMAETAKILNPDAEVILPDSESTCSLVTMTDVDKLKNDLSEISNTFDGWGEYKVVTYINSSVELKAFSDVICTSANVEDIINTLINSGHNVFFTPDRNMGAYLDSQHPEWGRSFLYFKDAVCEVHEKFKADELKTITSSWSNYGNYILAHPESPLPVLNMANYVGSTRGMLNWVKNFKWERGNIYVATEEGLLYNMRELRPELNIQLAPTYSGCQCNSCPYMKMNTAMNVKQAAELGIGTKIEIDNNLIEKARLPIERMLEFQRTGKIEL